MKAEISPYKAFSGFLSYLSRHSSISENWGVHVGSSRPRHCDSYSKHIKVGVATDSKCSIVNPKYNWYITAGCLKLGASDYLHRYNCGAGPIHQDLALKIGLFLEKLYSISWKLIS